MAVLQGGYPEKPCLRHSPEHSLVERLLARLSGLRYEIIFATSARWTPTFTGITEKPAAFAAQNPVLRNIS